MKWLFLKYQPSDDNLTYSQYFLEQKAKGINPKNQEIGIKFTIIECSNFDEQCSGAHFVSFLFYYYCNMIFLGYERILLSIKQTTFEGLGIFLFKNWPTFVQAPQPSCPKTFQVVCGLMCHLRSATSKGVQCALWCSVNSKKVDTKSVKAD